MSRIEDLIERFCPDGVQRVSLGSVTANFDSKRRPVTKSDRKGGAYPYYGANGIQDWVDDYLFDGIFLLVGEDGSVQTPDGKPVLNWAEGKIWVNNHAHVLQSSTDNLNLRFLFYALQTIEIRSLVTGGTQPKLNQKNLNSIQVPVPPLEVQREIVRILDQFTQLEAALEAELEAELEARHRQYEYLRNKELTFDNFVPRIALGELTRIKTGEAVSKKAIEDHPGSYPVINSGRDPLGYYEYFNTVDDPLGITSRGAGVGSVTWCAGTYFRGNLNYSVSIRDRHQTNERFLFHSLQYLQPQIQELCSFQGIPALNKVNLERLVVPLPNLETQEKIAKVLDRFEALTSDLNIGLPAEISSRRKQYEYYRDKLLTFKELAA